MLYNKSNIAIGQHAYILLEQDYDIREVNLYCVYNLM